MSHIEQLVAKISDLDRLVLLAYAENNMDASKTSRNEYMHRNTVIYHLHRVNEKTGFDPFKFYDLLQLINAINRLEGNVDA
jgi:carbohydrate diacid regulator